MSDEREVVRAWVARDGDGTCCLYMHTAPTLFGKTTLMQWDNGEDSSPEFKWGAFPTLAPGECWPVEIRRIKE